MSMRGFKLYYRRIGANGITFGWIHISLIRYDVVLSIMTRTQT